MGLTPGIIAAGDPCGRLTLTSATPVLTGTASAQGTVYLTPYLGNSHIIWDGTWLNSVQFTELSNVLANGATGNAGPAAVVANSNYDLFLWNNAGTLTLTRGPAWTETSTVTISIANPAVVTYTGHGILSGQNVPIVFSTTGALPHGGTTDIVAGTVYYINWIDANTFNIAATPGGANISTAGGAQSGTHTGVINFTTSRGTGAGTTQLTRLSNGVYVNTNAITNGPGANLGTYVGSIRTNATATVDYNIGAAAAGGTAGFFGLWNCYNRVPVMSNSRDSNTAWSYTSSTIRAADNSTGNRVSMIRGLDEDAILATYTCRLSGAAVAASNFSIGIGLDTTTAFTTVQTTMLPGVAANQIQHPTVPYMGLPGLGFHFLSANEQGDNSNAYTVGGNTFQALVAQLRA